MAVAVADCGTARSHHCLFHEHNQGGIFCMLSAGDEFRESTLEVKDNKTSRTQDKNYTALGRPGVLIRRDGLGIWEELPKDVRVALGRLDALFDTENVLYTNMVRRAFSSPAFRLCIYLCCVCVMRQHSVCASIHCPSTYMLQARCLPCGGKEGSAKRVCVAQIISIRCEK